MPAVDEAGPLPRKPEMGWSVPLQSSWSCGFWQRRVRIRYPLFGIDDVFEVQDFRFNIGDGGILLGCTLQVASMPAEAFGWDATAEEGDAPIAEETNVESTIPVPADLSFGVTRITVGNQQVPLGVITFARPVNLSLRVEGRYKQASASDWTVIPIGNDATEAQTGALSDGVQYEAQIRYVSVSGRQGEWSASEYVTPVADPTAPAAVEDVDAVGGTGAVSMSWTAPNSPNYGRRTFGETQSMSKRALLSVSNMARRLWLMPGRIPALPPAIITTGSARPTHPASRVRRWL